jgi:ATP-dependent Clp protease adaptor protein ClpS
MLLTYMNETPKFDEQEDVLTETVTSTGLESSLIVYNDDHNTFDWVIQCFMEVCNHTQEQSEQLSLLIHFKGKATVKTGSFEFLKPMKDALVDRGLSAVIETTVPE